MTAQHAPHTPLWRRFISLPQTGIGWWAVGLAAAASALFAFGSFVSPEEIQQWLHLSEAFTRAFALPLFVTLMGALLAGMLSGLAGGVVALIAVLRSHERSGLVWVAIVVGLAFLTYLSMQIGN
jgi:hypothetical protein